MYKKILNYIYIYIYTYTRGQVNKIYPPLVISLEQGKLAQGKTSLVRQYKLLPFVLLGRGAQQLTHIQALSCPFWTQAVLVDSLAILSALFDLAWMSWPNNHTLQSEQPVGLELNKMPSSQLVAAKSGHACWIVLHELGLGLCIFYNPQIIKFCWKKWAFVPNLQIYAAKYPYFETIQ